VAISENEKLFQPAACHYDEIKGNVGRRVHLALLIGEQEREGRGKEPGLSYPRRGERRAARGYKTARSGKGKEEGLLLGAPHPAFF